MLSQLLSLGNVRLVSLRSCGFEACLAFAFGMHSLLGSGMMRKLQRLSYR
jgi:hypothetical protein